MIYAGVFILAFLIGMLITNFVIKRNHKSEMHILEKQIIEFLDGEEKIPTFSVEDNRYAALINSIVELEERYLRQHENIDNELKENAEFIADISHQLKTPLAGIKLYCEMDNAPHCEKQLILIEHIQRHIKSLLRLEKLRANAYTLEFGQYKIRDIVESSWEKLQLLYQDKKLKIHGSETLRCDRYWLGEALMNILKNSCEHTKKDGVINVSISRQQASVFVEIEDNGGGIKINKLESIFTRFTRLNNGKNTDGVGLGLAITKAIVEKHHGSVFANNISSGFKITFCFPIISGHLTIM